MPSVTPLIDREEIRRRLNADRVWSIYALADLDPELFPHCQWWISGDGLALVFHGISIRPIFVAGSGNEVRDLLAALAVDRGYLNLRDHHLEAAQSIYEYQEPHRMHRMVVDALRPCSVTAAPVSTLGPEDLAEIQQLYATGDGGGVAFGAFQLDTGFFRGIRHNDELVAVAGVHVVSRSEGVAGVGNVFTRPDHRSEGLAKATTSAVVSDLMAAGIATIGLNVEDNNVAAIAAYKRLGFRTAFEYWEGSAVRRSGSPVHLRAITAV